MSNYYQLLGVSQTASESEIRLKFRKKAKAHHPDLHQNSSPSEQKKHQKLFIQLSQAYEILSNAQTRQKYDQQRASQKQKEQRQSTARSRTQARSQSSTRSRSKNYRSSEFKQSANYSKKASTPPEDDDTLEDLIHDVEELLQGFSLEFRDPLEMLLQWARRIFRDSLNETKVRRDTSSPPPPFSDAENSFSDSSFMHEVEEELARLKRSVHNNPKAKSSQGTKIDKELEMLKKKLRKG